MAKIPRSAGSPHDEVAEIRIGISEDASVITATCTAGTERDTAQVLAAVAQAVPCEVQWHPASTDPDEAQREAARGLARLAAELAEEAK